MLLYCLHLFVFKEGGTVLAGRKERAVGIAYISSWLRKAGRCWQGGKGIVEDVGGHRQQNAVLFMMMETDGGVQLPKRFFFLLFSNNSMICYLFFTVLRLVTVLQFHRHASSQCWCLDAA